MPKQRALSFYKRHWFIGLTAVIGLIGSLVGIITGIKSYLEPKPPARLSNNTEIVFDRSKGMTPTKLDLARNAVDLILRDKVLGGNLAFREFGSRSCTESYTPPTVAFGKDNVERIRKIAKAVVPDGEAALIAAIRHAITDFNDSQRFGDVFKHIIVITGNLDSCDKQIVEIVQQLNNLPPTDRITLDLNFIGVGLDSEAKSKLDGYAERTGGSAHFADNPDELKNVVEIVEIARVRRAGESVSDVVNASAKLLRSVIMQVKAKDYAAAELGLKSAREELARSNLPFQNLAKRKDSEQFDPQYTEHYRRIYDAAGRSRDIQSQVIAITETILSQAKAADEQALRTSIDRYEEIATAYNKSDQELHALIEQLKDITRLRGRQL
jgi:hypothetical protein